MAIVTALTGPFPRSEALVAATRDLDRGRTTTAAVDALVERAEAEISGHESRLGLGIHSGGYLAWADLFRPFSESWRGFTVGPVTRWFETNTFYRQPILHAPPERVEGAIARHLPPSARADPPRAKVTLPGPFTFSGLLENRSGETREALTHRMGRLLGEEVRSLLASGFTTFQFQEPLLVVERPTGPLAEAAVEAYRSIQTAAPSAATLVWTFFADAAPTFDLLGRLPVGGVGIDLSETDPERIPESLSGRGVGLGVIDPRTTLREDPEVVARIARDLSKRLHPSTLWLGAGAPLDLLPYEPAVRKIELLGQVRERLALSGTAA
ncbi:MAG: hypothetical protein L3J93_00145 [Thermoplasmata archaeon]|nr:hypothetical protein [Thermoplasmata archaeon]